VTAGSVAPADDLRTSADTSPEAPVGELVQLPATVLAARVRSGATTAVEVARAHLARVAARDRMIGAFEASDAERVLAEAGGVDARPDRFALPLAGVPVAVNDNVPVAGYATRYGSAATSTDPARRDDELVRRLRRAGAVVVGKTRMPELAAWAFAHSALGTTRNPRNTARDPGGSGGAAAVADGMAALALGTDGGGSIRVSAAYCGLVGLKPGTGAVPLPGGAAEHWYGLSAVGPLARTAADAAVLFAVLAGHDPAAAVAAVEDGARRDLRVAVSLRSPSPVAELRAGHRLATVGAAVLLRAGGAHLAAADPPYPRSLPSHWSTRWQAGVARELADLGLDVTMCEPRTAAVARQGRRVLRLGGPRPATAAAWRARFLAWLDAGRHDVLLTPAVAGPPVTAGAMRHRGYLTTLLLSASRVPYTQAWNLAGLPAAAVPVRVSGRPVAVQLVGRPGDELALLAIAARLEGREVPDARVNAG
jgi:amidase